MHQDEGEQLVQFQDESRCFACKNNNLECWSGKTDEKCKACDTAGRTCTFSLTITARGPKQLLEFNSFIGEKLGQSPFIGLDSRRFGQYEAVEEIGTPRQELRNVADAVNPQNAKRSSPFSAVLDSRNMMEPILSQSRRRRLHDSRGAREMREIGACWPCKIKKIKARFLLICELLMLIRKSVAQVTRGI